MFVTASVGIHEKFLEMCEPIKRLLRTYWESIKNISITSLGPQSVQQPVYGFGCCLSLSVCFKYLIYLINEYFGSSAFYKNLLIKNKCQQITNSRWPNWNVVVIVSSNAQYQFVYQDIFLIWFLLNNRNC